VLPLCALLDVYRIGALQEGDNSIMHCTHPRTHLTVYGVGTHDIGGAYLTFPNKLNCIKTLVWLAPVRR
jgi:hypothetical protein